MCFAGGTGSAWSCRLRMACAIFFADPTAMIPRLLPLATDRRMPPSSRETGHSHVLRRSPVPSRSAVVVPIRAGRGSPGKEMWVPDVFHRKAQRSRRRCRTGHLNGGPTVAMLVVGAWCRTANPPDDLIGAALRPACDATASDQGGGRPRTHRPPGPSATYACWSRMPPTWASHNQQAGDPEGPGKQLSKW